MNDRIQQAKQVDLREVAGLKASYRRAEYWLCYCPFHNDEAGGRHSLLLYRDHFVCLSTNCGMHGDIFVWYNWKSFGSKESPRGQTFLSILDMILGAPRIELPAGAPDEVDEVDLDHLAEEYHRALFEADPKRLRYYLKRRLLTIETVKQQMMGWDGQGYTIPVWEGKSRDSSVIGIRIRSAVKDAKMRYSGVRGYNDQVLYNREALLFAIEEAAPAILIFYGELDAQLAWQNGLYAVSPTNGALAVLPEWFSSYPGYKIVVPDKKEEHAAFDDAAEFGSHGAVIQFPKDNPGKDYTEYRLAGGSSLYFVKMVRRLLGVSIRLRKAQCV